jgi:hypothetical protein
MVTLYELRFQKTLQLIGLTRDRQTDSKRSEGKDGFPKEKTGRFQTGLFRLMIQDIGTELLRLALPSGHLLLEVPAGMTLAVGHPASPERSAAAD